MLWCPMNADYSKATWHPAGICFFFLFFFVKSSGNCFCVEDTQSQVHQPAYELTIRGTNSRMEDERSFCMISCRKQDADLHICSHFTLHDLTFDVYRFMVIWKQISESLQKADLIWYPIYRKLINLTNIWRLLSWPSTKSKTTGTLKPDVFW